MARAKRARQVCSARLRLPWVAPSLLLASRAARASWVAPSLLLASRAARASRAPSSSLCLGMTSSWGTT
eukprot:10144532-Lingulodinium_polyedra.AAC.1